MTMKNPFSNTTAIVTGGASGIGRALCRELARRGAAVTVADLNGDAADRVAAEITAAGWKARACALDVSNESAVYRAVEDSVAGGGRLDYYFNNAGIGISADALDLGIEQWRKVFDVNLFGVLYGTMAAYAAMARQGSGHIVNVSSMAGFAPFSMNAPYTAAKYGVVGLTDALRHEASARGVRMTLVCPGIVRTSFYDAMEVVGTDRGAYTGRLPRRLIGPEKAALIILGGVVRKRRLIIFPFHARVLWWVKKLAPVLLDLMNRYVVREFRSLPR
jgi:NAD(P)-dependent dehydrogenase (short-subunit alcohol dehydrogenase family)